MESETNQKLLVFNCHEAWVHQLQSLDRPMDVIIGLRGHHKTNWDECVRPVPQNAKFVALDEALAQKQPYHCIIAHSIADLLDVRRRNDPKLAIIHSTLEGRVLEENSNITPQQMATTFRQYIALTKTHAVAVSNLKGKSWGVTGEAIPFGVNVSDYPPCTAEIAAGLRICNYIDSRKKILLWDLHEKAFGGLPVKIVGHNPGCDNIGPSRNWNELKSLLASHRFYIHTAETTLEDGYNMATVEAMAAGLPILGNCHPTSPIEHGVSGFLSNDPNELRQFALLLLNDKDLAIRMGQAARKKAQDFFSMQKFTQRMNNAIEAARQKQKQLSTKSH